MSSGYFIPIDDYIDPPFFIVYLQSKKSMSGDLGFLWIWTQLLGGKSKGVLLEITSLYVGKRHVLGGTSGVKMAKYHNFQKFAKKHCFRTY